MRVQLCREARLTATRHELGTQMIGRLGALEDLSLWSWTYELPVAEILRSCRRLKTLAISAHDVVRDDVLALMPSTLETLLVCSHIEFSVRLRCCTDLR